MKYVCMRTCQLRVHGRARFISRGTVIELEKDPGNRFRSIGTPEAAPVNFLTAKEGELQNSKWTFKAAQKAILDQYGVKLFKEEGTKKSDIIGQILDARFRAIDKSVLEKPRLD